MKDVTEAAGFFLAHAVWCIEDGDALIPMLGYIDRSGQRYMTRFEADRLEDAAREAKDALRSGVAGGVAGFSIVDGYLAWEGRRLEALLLEARDFARDEYLFTVAVPYTHDNETLSVHRPKFLFVMEGASVPALAEWLFSGVSQHEKGAEVWRNALDESL